MMTGGLKYKCLISNIKDFNTETKVFTVTITFSNYTQLNFIYANDLCFFTL